MQSIRPNDHTQQKVNVTNGRSRKELIGVLIVVLLGLGLFLGFIVCRHAANSKTPVESAKAGDVNLQNPTQKKTIEPTTASSPEVRVCGQHKVVAGDTLSQITLNSLWTAKKAVYEYIASVNHISNPNIISVGITILIPCGFSLTEKVTYNYKYHSHRPRIRTAKRYEPSHEFPIGETLQDVNPPMHNGVPTGSPTPAQAPNQDAPVQQGQPQQQPHHQMRSFKDDVVAPEFTLASLHTESLPETPLIGIGSSRPKQEVAPRQEASSTDSTPGEQWYVYWVTREQFEHADPILMEELLKLDSHQFIPAYYVQGKLKNGDWRERDATAVRLAHDEKNTIYLWTKLPHSPSSNSALVMNPNGKPVELASDILQGQGKIISKPPASLVNSYPQKPKEDPLLKKTFRKRPGVLRASLEKAIPFLTLGARGGMGFMTGGPIGVAFVSAQMVAGKLQHPRAPSTPVEYVLSGEMDKIHDLESRVKKLEEGQQKTSGTSDTASAGSSPR